MKLGLLIKNIDNCLVLNYINYGFYKERRFLVSCKYFIESFFRNW